MRDRQLGHVLHQVRTLAAGRQADHLPDHELLRRFADGRDEAAFAALVRRHGAMVLGVCRRVLRHTQDAEDACQATFLALAKKAASVRSREALGGWLYRVAYNLALKVRNAVARRSARGGAVECCQADAAEEVTWREALGVLDEELSRLPADYRAPLVLCYLEGRTQDEAARQLGWSLGALRGRLERGRDKLRARLARRGVGLPAALLGAALGQGAAAAALTASASTIVRAAGRYAAGGAGAVPARVAALAEKGAQVMSTATLKVAAVLMLAVAVLGAGVGLAARQAVTANQPATAKQPADRPADPRLAFDPALAREKKFVVVGKVVTADGKTALEGVEVTASAGIGSLGTTGETKTDRNGRFRLVFPSGLAPVGGVAIVHARKPGWHGWSYGWPAHFVLSEEPLDRRDVPAKTTNIVPGKPFKVEFRMQEAAALRVKLVDGAGRPMANTRVWLTGEDLPPGGSVIADRRTGADGTFAVDDVPRSSYRLVVIEDGAGGRGKLELGSIRFRDAAEYRAVATIHEWAPGSTHVSLKATRGPNR